MMRWMPMLAWLSAAVVTIASAQPAKTFTVTAIESRCPEYGTLLKSYVLLTDQFQIHFCDLENWASRVDAARQSVTFQSPDTLTFVALALRTKNKTASTNVVATNHVDAAQAGAVSEAVKRLQQIVPAAKVKLEADCFAAGVKGQSVDFEAATQRGQVQGRLAWLDFADCDLVVTVSTLGDFKPAHVVFNRFVNSLQLDKAPPKGLGN